MEKIDSTNDELKCAQEKNITKSFEPDEKVILSCMTHKFNKKAKRQERGLLITSKALYNLSKTNIKRRIPITKIVGVTLSKTSYEFVIHIPEEYDYRYSSPEKRDKILESIALSYNTCTKDKLLAFYFKEDPNLIQFTTTKADKKKNVSRIPTDKPLYFNTQGLKENKINVEEELKNDKERTKTLFSKKKQEKDITIDDFNLLKVLGRGAFGKVMLVEHKATKEIFAMKSLRKEELIDKDQIEHTKTEKMILESINHPFLVGLECAFQTPEKLFFVMDFMKGGELFQHLKQARRFTEARAKFYVASVALALGHLHSKDIIYRDLKPENILLDEEGYVHITDFGMAKFLKKDTLATSFVGTPEYLAPEIIASVGHGKEADWWSLGILAYETMIGIPPFYHQNVSTMYELIQTASVKFPPTPEISADAKDFILKLLNRDVKKRLGSVNDFEEIKKHAWFKDIDWDQLYQKKIPAPFKPKVSGDNWMDNFDQDFVQEEAINSYVGTNQDLLKQYQSEFKF